MYSLVKDVTSVPLASLDGETWWKCEVKILADGTHCMGHISGWWVQNFIANVFLSHCLFFFLSFIGMPTRYLEVTHLSQR